MNNITLGKYIPLNSFIHKLDPRTKIICMILILVGVFIDAGWLGYGILLALLVFAVVLSKLSFSFIWKNLKPSLTMLFILLILNAFFIKTGDVLFTIGNFQYHIDALMQTLYIVVRLLLMIITTTLLAATTKPLDMTLAIEDLLAPLEKIKVPTHDIAMMISLALRFIPTLLEEAQRIIKAQASRGVDMNNGNLKEKINGVLALIIPLFVSCFQKADDLADAMEARGYVCGGQRVRYKQLKLTYRDFIVYFISVMILAGLIMISIWMR